MKKYRLYENVLFKSVGSEYFALANDGETISSVNAIGSEVLSALKENKAIDDILKWIIETYEVKEEKARDDLNEYLECLIKENIVEAY